MNEKDITFVLRFRNAAARSIGTFRSQLAKVGASARTAQAGLKTFSNTAKVMGERLSVAGRRVQQAGERIRTAGTTVAFAIGAPIAGAVGTAVRAFADFESGLAGVAKTVNAPREQIAAIGRQLQDLSDRVPIAATELLGVAQAAGQLGVSTENIAQFTEVASKLGVSTDLSAEEAAVALTRLSNAAGVSQTQFGNLASNVVALGNNFSVFEGELIDIGNRIAPAARVIGFTASQTLAFGAAVRAVGIPVESGGTAISQALVQIATAANEGGKKLSVFARTAGLSAGAFRQLVKDNPVEAVVKFEEGLDRLNKTGGNSFGVLKDVQLQGRRVGNTLLALAGNTDVLRGALGLSSKAFRENTALNREAGIFFATLANRIKVVFNQLRNTAKEFGEAFKPVIDDVLASVGTFNERLRGLAERLKDTAPETKRLILIVAGIAVALGPALIAIGAFVQLSGFAAVGLGKLTREVGAFFKTLSGARVAALLTNPLGLAVAAIGAAAAALFYFRDSIVTVEGQTAAVRDFVVAAWQLIREQIGFAAMYAVDLWNQAVQAIGLAFGDLPDLVTPDLQTLYNAFKAFGNGVIGAFEVVGRALLLPFQLAFKFIDNLVKRTVDGITKLKEIATLISQGEFKAALDVFNEPRTGLFDGLGEAATEGIDKIKAVFDANRDPIGELMGLVGDRASKLFNERTLKGVVQEDPLKKAVEMSNAAEAAKAVVQPVVKTFNDLFNEGFTNAVDAYLKNARDVAKLTEDAFTNSFNTIEEGLLDFVEKGKLDFRGLVTSILREFNRLAIKSVLGDLLSLGTGGGLAQGGLLSGIGRLFGVGAAAAAEGGLSQSPVRTALVPVSAFRQARRFAAGGTTNVGGDRLPALLSANEAVVPLTRNRAIPIENRGGGGNTVVNVTIQAQDVDSFRRSQQQIASQIGRTVDRAVKRNR